VICGTAVALHNDISERGSLVFSSYGDLASDVSGYALFALIAFTVLFIAILALIAKGGFGSAIRGLFALITSFFAAPFSYLQSVVRMLIANATSTADDADSKQNLLRKVIALLNAGLLLTTVAIIAAGIVVSWIALYPPEQRAQRRALTVQIEETERGIDAKQAEIAKVKADSDPSKAAKKSAEMERETAKLNADLGSARTRASEEPNSLPALNNIEAYLARQRLSSQSQIDGMVQEVTRYIDQNVSSEVGKQALSAYLSAWQQFAKAKFDESEHRRTVEGAKAQIEMAEAQVRVAKEQLERLKANRAEMGMLLTPGNIFASIKAFLWTLLLAFCWVWIVGLAIESAGLFIDLAENVRRVRACSERQPELAHMT